MFCPHCADELDGECGEFVCYSCTREYEVNVNGTMRVTFTPVDSVWDVLTGKSIHEEEA
jgi:hypothetical protein